MKTSMRTISQIHDAFDRRELSPIEFTRGFLARAQASKLNAYLTLFADRAMAQARHAQEILDREGVTPRQRHPLLGIPLALKDNLTLQGQRTTCGSRMLADYKPPYSATVVRRLEAAGAVILGKTNLDEFGMGGSNENSAFGPVIHPTHSDRVAGGSSGGSAAAVAADLAWAALGSDTGGSVRQPAAFCGILGLKPTYGKISRSGLVAFASSLDTVGILARSPQDAELLLSVCSGGDELDATSLPEAPYAPDESGTPFEWSGLRLGVASDISESDLDPEVARAVRLFQERLCGLGASRVVLDFPHASQAVAVYYLIAMAEASSNLSRFDGVRFGSRAPEAESASDLKGFYQKVRSQFGSEVKRRILLGTFALSSGYRDAFFRRAAQVRRLIARDFDSAWSRADVLVLPVAPEPAFRLGERNSDPLKMYLADRFTVPANLAGLPALSIPCGTTSEGLPIGVQLIAPAGREDLLLSIARALEPTEVE